MTGRAAFSFPIMVEVRDVPVFVAGGGHEAEAKARTLADLGANVRLWLRGDPEPPSSTPASRQIAGAHARVVVHRGPFDPALLDGARLAIVDTGDRELDHRVAAEARRLGVLVNTVDDVDHCDWSAPAVLRRGALTIAIATAGVAPALAVRLRDSLADVIGPELGDLLVLLGDVRPRIRASGRPFAARRRLWYELIDGPALDHLHAGRELEARAALDSAIAAWEAAG
jgi:siroheme synthase-like protein